MRLRSGKILQSLVSSHGHGELRECERIVECKDGSGVEPRRKTTEEEYVESSPAWRKEICCISVSLFSASEVVLDGSGSILTETVTGVSRVSSCEMGTDLDNIDASPPSVKGESSFSCIIGPEESNGHISNASRFWGPSNLEQEMGFISPLYFGVWPVDDAVLQAYYEEFIVCEPPNSAFLSNLLHIFLATGEFDIICDAFRKEFPRSVCLLEKLYTLYGSGVFLDEAALHDLMSDLDPKMYALDLCDFAPYLGACTPDLLLACSVWSCFFFPDVLRLWFYSCWKRSHSAARRDLFTRMALASTCRLKPHIFCYI